MQTAQPTKAENGRTTTNLSSFNWSVADLLRSDYRRNDFDKVILLFAVLRRLDRASKATKCARQPSCSVGGPMVGPLLTSDGSLSHKRCKLPNKLRQNR
jgi:hypothetical protein